MLNREISDIVSASRGEGWVLEPEAKRLLSLAGIPVPRFRWAKSFEDAAQFAGKIGYPVVAKVVSPRLVHKSDAGGVVTGICDGEKLAATFSRFSRLAGFDGMLVEETLSGTELIVGARVDYQFGPVILVGMGGTRAEIYRDVSLRMAPLNPGDAERMVRGLRARRIFEGFRGSAPVSMEGLEGLVMNLSRLVMELGESFESMDLNPVMCSAAGCVVADARIMLPRG
jgi:acetate---CoA ligase (ADP-forming) subunit beta